MRLVDISLNLLHCPWAVIATEANEKGGSCDPPFYELQQRGTEQCIGAVQRRRGTGIFENQGFKDGVLLGGNPGVGFLKVEGALVQGPAAYRAHQAGAEGKGVELLHVG